MLVSSVDDASWALTAAATSFVKELSCLFRPRVAELLPRRGVPAYDLLVNES